MKKVFLTFITFMVVLSMSAFAEIKTLPFEPAEIDIKITKSKNLKQIEVNNEIPQSYDLAFKNKDDTYEIRVLEFKITDDSISNEDLKKQWAIYSIVIAQNMINNEKALKNFVPVPDAGVKKENNGDCGFVLFVQYDDESSEFYKGYKYAIINSFLNYKKGIVIKTIMFNSKDVMDDEHYSKDFQIFKY